MNIGSALSTLNLMCEWMSGNGTDVTVVASDEWKNLPLDSIIASRGSSEERERPGTDLLQTFAKRMTWTFLAVSSTEYDRAIIPLYDHPV
ncbi:hypothetical protein JVU11DRAFT_5635 [Chiua virens]|nr:hypothetical protein JVU11DRAFT_5635 [Chiua virens]